MAKSRVPANQNDDERAKAARRREREEASASFLEDDDGETLEHEVSTSVNYLVLPVGKRVTGYFREFKPDKDMKGNPTERPVLIVNGQTCILPGHAQLVLALKKVKPGALVRIACEEKVDIGNGRTAWNYSVSSSEADDDRLPF